MGTAQSTEGQNNANINNNNNINNNEISHDNNGDSSNSIPSSPSSEDHHHQGHSPHHTPPPQLSNQPRSLELFHQQAIGAQSNYSPYYRPFDEPVAEYTGNHNHQIAPQIPSDGYRWRKYGQKNVRGCPKGRSYYKCTYPGCNTKKTVNMGDGTTKEEITYRGNHNHPPPVVTRLNASDQESFKHTVLHENSPLPPTSLSISFSQSSYLFPVQNMLPPNIHNSGNINNPHNLNPPHNHTVNNNNNTPSPHLNSISSVLHSLNNNNPPSNTNPVHSPTLISTTTTVITQTLKEPEPEAYSYETENQALKRLHNPTPNIHVSPETSSQLFPNNVPPQPPTTPRLVIETNVNVDHLDDGFHWRKYGQKTVKGSPYPRSYYKCTEKGCSVKKQVEQVGNTVVNSYDGTHTHAAPGLLENIRKKRKTTPRLAISNLTNNTSMPPELGSPHNHHAEHLHHNHLDMNQEHSHSVEHNHPLHAHPHLHHEHHENVIENVPSDNENENDQVIDCHESDGEAIHDHENHHHEHSHTHSHPHTYAPHSPSLRVETNNQVAS
eukprot:TRINITY_DN2213_c0_g1_i1.p1 TRINITY_DN2213_c0_g1~~TRINITY_DN2213_c0_g1_i1.p1  ORF type:complete len:550 (-),score=130.87 TRINITY_DN2213_c0_g1_i1:124-1773(-)